MQPEDLLAPDRLSTFASMIVAVLVALGSFGLVAAMHTRFWRLRKMAIAAANVGDTADTATALAPAKYAVIAGDVRTEDDDAIAIRLVIKQRGAEHQVKSRWRHTWSEESRSLDAKPFYVETASGEVVRVEPDDRLTLIDDLEIERHGKDRRERIAEVNAGDHVWVEGELVQGYNPRGAREGYRDAGTGLVLRPRRDQPMMLSTEPLGERFARKSRRARTWWIAAAVVALVLNAGFLGGFWASAARGHVVHARVLGVHAKSDRLGNPAYFYVDGEYDDGATTPSFTLSCSKRAYEALDTLVTSGTPSTVAVRVVPGLPSLTELGEQPTLPNLASALFLVILFLGVARMRDENNEWYERRPLVENGNGRLSQSE